MTKKDLERELPDASHIKLSDTGAQHDKFRRGGMTVTVSGHWEIRETIARGRREAGLL